MIMGLMDFAKSAAKTVLGVQEHGSPQLAEYRMNICRGCEHFRPEHQNCAVCGCFMDVKTTLLTNRNLGENRVEITHCPNGFWADIHIANMYRTLDGKEPLKTTNKHITKWHITN